MPRIIRKALVDQILSSNEVREALDDLSLVAGVSVRFMTALGEEVRGGGPGWPPSLCRWMGADPARGRICTQTIQTAMEGALPSGSCALVCPAGLWEAAVPVWMVGEVLGYVVLGQVADGAADTAHINHWRHALEREGRGAEREHLEPLRTAVREIDREHFAAIVRLAQRTVRHLETLLERGVSGGSHHQAIPGVIRRGLAYMRNHFQESLTLADLARETGMSRQHFCTLFHKATGMGFSHYLSWVRIEEACRRLDHTRDSITDIAFASGFQSLSQFNRVFRRIRKCSPRQYRHDHATGR